MLFDLPQQRVSDSIKQTEDWYIKTMNYWINYALSTNDKTVTARAMNAANGKVDSDAYKYILNPLNTEDPALKNLPGTIRDVDFVTPIRERYMGEFLEIPYKFTVMVKDANAVLERTNVVKDGIRKIAIETAAQMIESKGQAPIPDFVKLAEDFKNKVINDASITAQQRLDYINYINKFDILRYKAYSNWWCTEEFYTHVKIEGDNVVMELVDPLEGFPIENGEEFVEDMDGFVWVKKMTINQIIDTYRHVLKPKELDYIDNMLIRANKSSGDVNVPLFVAKSYLGDRRYNNYNTYGFNNKSNFRFCGGDRVVNVYHTTFKTNKEIKVVTRLDEFNNEYEVTVNTDYEYNEALGDTSIRTEYINSFMTGVRIGDESVGIFIPPTYDEIQRQDINNPSKIKSSFGGKKGILNNIDINPVSLRLVPYLVLYRIYTLQLERTIAKYKGDIQIIPQSMFTNNPGKTPKEQMYYMLADNTIIYDDTEVDLQTAVQGFRIVGNRGLDDYIRGLMEIIRSVKAEAMEMASMTNSRYGNISAYAGKSNTEQDIYRGQITSGLSITMFNESLSRVHQCVLEYVKYAWRNGKQGSFINPSTGEQTIINATPDDLPYDALGIFVSNSVTDIAKLKAIRDIAFSASQNGDTELAIEAVTNDNIEELKKYVTKHTELSRQLQQAEAEAQRKHEAEMATLAASNLDKELKNNIDVQLLKNSGVTDVNVNNNNTKLEQTRINNQPIDNDGSEQYNKDREHYAKIMNDSHNEEMDIIKAGNDRHKTDTALAIAKENKNYKDK